MSKEEEKKEEKKPEVIVIVSPLLTHRDAQGAFMAILHSMVPGEREQCRALMADRLRECGQGWAELEELARDARGGALSPHDANPSPSHELRQLAAMGSIRGAQSFRDLRRMSSASMRALDGDTHHTVCGVVGVDGEVGVRHPTNVHEMSAIGD
eukprot:gene55906-35506_t